MNKGLTIAKNEFLELLPPTIFFFIAIGLLMLTKRLVVKQYDIHVSDFAVVVVGAFIIGKVVLIADHFPFVDKYPGKPLIYNVLWKTGIYFIAACVVRLAEEIIPKIVDSGHFAETIGQAIDAIACPHFWVIHLWLGVLLFVYCALRELIRTIGKDDVVRLFLGYNGETTWHSVPDHARGSAP